MTYPRELPAFKARSGNVYIGLEPVDGGVYLQCDDAECTTCRDGMFLTLTPRELRPLTPTARAMLKIAKAGR